MSSTAKVEAVRALGADHIVDYTREDFTVGARRYDVILKIGGNRRLSHLTARPHLARAARHRRRRDRRATAWWRRPADPGDGALPVRLSLLGTFVASENAEDLDALRGLIEAEKLAPVIDRAFPLGEMPAAIRYLLDRRARGKIVVTLGA